MKFNNLGSAMTYYQGWQFGSLKFGSEPYFFSFFWINHWVIRKTEAWLYY